MATVVVMMATVVVVMATTVVVVVATTVVVVIPSLLPSPLSSYRISNFQTIERFDFTNVSGRAAFHLAITVERRGGRRRRRRRGGKEGSKYMVRG